jgi:hypothetical protein
MLWGGVSCGDSTGNVSYRPDKIVPSPSVVPPAPRRQPRARGGRWHIGSATKFRGYIVGRPVPKSVDSGRSKEKVVGEPSNCEKTFDPLNFGCRVVKGRKGRKRTERGRGGGGEGGAFSLRE